MVNLKQRSTVPEIMDDFTLPHSEVVPVLIGLENMNTLFGGHQTIIEALQKLPVQNGWHISDWGCGGGDALRAIAKWAATKQLDIKLTGVDATPSAVEYARNAAKAFNNISFISADVMSGQLEQFDVVYSSLFTHHFADAEWIALVKKMLACSKKAVIITDLHRHWLLYYAIKILTWFTKNTMARNDGPLSVQRAFTKAELVRLLAQCSIQAYSINWIWPFRWQVIIPKPA